MTPRTFDIYGKSGNWIDSGATGCSAADALVASAERHPHSFRQGTVYIVVESGHAGHGKAKLLKLESVPQPRLRAVQA